MKNEKVSIAVSFLSNFPDAKQHIFRIREIVNVQVTREFDIVRQYAQNYDPSQEIPNNVNESDNDPIKYHKKVINQLQSSFYRPKLQPYRCTIFVTFRGIRS